MELFGKKKEACCCGGSVTNENMKEAEKIKTEMGIKILGSGCSKCNALEENVKQAMAELNIDEAIDHVTDFTKIASYGVMSTPALVIDGSVASFGKVLKKEEAITILKNYRETDK